MPRRTRESQPSTSRGFSSTVTQMECDTDSDGENSNQNIDLLITNFVKYIINYSSNKMPIKRNELVKELKIAQRVFPGVLSAGKEILKDVYGLGLAELAETKSTRSFITFPVIKLPTSMMLSSEIASEVKTLFIVLSYIFMKSGEIQDTNLNIFLEKINVNLEEFAKTKEKFIKQLYLKRRKVEIEGQNESHTYYSWGERASLEFNKQDVLEAVSKLVKKPSANFIIQHREAYGEDPSQMDSIMVE